MERVEVLPGEGIVDWSSRHDLQICQNMAHCNHCGTNFAIPDGSILACEAFRNKQPSGHLVVWALPAGQRLPTFRPDAPPDLFTEEPVVHECQSGKPVKAYSTELDTDACSDCGVKFVDGDSAYVNEDQIIKTEGKTVFFTTNAYVLCGTCARKEEEDGDR